MFFFSVLYSFAGEVKGLWADKPSILFLALEKLSTNTKNTMQGFVWTN